jgi:hypothetical protein
LVLFVLAVTRAFSQAQNTGTVSGNVIDPQGSVVVGARVVLALAGQERQVATVTDDKGEYLFSDVAVGIYQLRVEAPGFTSYVIDGIQVDADQNVRADAPLQVGSVGAQVEVEASGTTVDSRSATIGTTIDHNLVENLPIDGNNVVSLAALLPGVTNVNAPTTFTSDVGGPTFNVSGSRSNQNVFLFDGLLWSNLFYNTGLNYPPPHSLQETSILLNNYKAQYGRNAGSVYNVLTRSGTNSFHGTVWEYVQNKAFNASDYISKLNPKLVSNQFGLTLGGPIRRDHIFFFLTYQDLRQVAQATGQARVPDLQQRGLSAPGVGRPCVSSQFAGMNCASFVEDFPGAPQLKNPFYTASYVGSATSIQNAAWAQAGNSGTSPCVTLLGTTYRTQYLPNGEIPSVCFNPVAVNFYNKYLPLPNLTISGDPHYLVSTANQPRNDQEGMIRVDIDGKRQIIDAHFYVTNANDRTANNISAGQGIAGYEPDLNTGGIYFGNIGDTFTVTSNLINVLRVGYKRYTYVITPTVTDTWQSMGSNLVIPGHPALPKVEATNWFTAGSPNSVYSNTINESIEFDDNISWQHGRHNYQAGVQYLGLQYLHRFDTEPLIEAEQQYTGDSIGDFIMGNAYAVNVGNSTNLAAIQHAAYFFAQDDWRATARLTLNVGLRYEMPSPWYSPDRQGVTFVPGYQSTVFPGAPSSMAFEGDPGIPDSIASAKYYYLTPRVGFAYDVFGNGNTSIRGGFGIFFDNLNANIVGAGEPFHYAANYSQPAGGFSQPLLGQPAVPDNYVKGNAQFVGPYTINFADKNLTSPYVEAMNLGVQQHLRKSALLEVNWVGKLGRKQLVPYDMNPAIYDCSGAFFQANPTVYCTNASNTVSSGSYTQRVLYPGYNYGGQGVVDMASIGTSNYNGLQVVYTQRMKPALNILASYTWSRSLDEQSNGQTNTSSVPQPKNLKTQYGPSDFNVTQVLNMGWIVRPPQLRSGFRALRAAANNWSFGGIFNAHTGMPFNVTISGDQSLTGERPQRASLVPGANPSAAVDPVTGRKTHNPGEWFNTSAFATPALGTFSTLSRNAFNGPGYVTTHFSLARMFTLPREGTNLQFRADAFNALNSANLSNPNASLANSTTNATANNFGKILSTVGTNGAVGTNGRRMQLSLILHY